ncbi:MAG TPA: MBL fold metallo-hydrolase [Burkholderiales bacterium]|nr:MBL fold metallo-hydrolase [Burkholderiales bacterium]
MSPTILAFDHGISAIESGYYRPGLAAVHLVVEGECAAIVDPCTNFSVPAVLAALEMKGVARERVEWVFLTHVHLDHAGGTGELIRHLPNARVAVHPRGARHMADPARLVAGSIAVYGERDFHRLYGEILPVPAERIVEAPDEFSVNLDGRRFLFLDTPGHARHHNAIFDETSRSFFTGDIFGVSYREFDVAGREYVFFASTPSQFDPDAAHASLDRLMSHAPAACYLMHYSRLLNPEIHAAALHRSLDASVALARRAAGAGANRRATLVDGMRGLLVEGARAHGCRLPRSHIEALLAMDILLNVQGLEAWLDAPPA